MISQGEKTSKDGNERADKVAKVVEDSVRLPEVPEASPAVSAAPRMLSSAIRCGTYVFWSSSWKSLRMNRAESPYDRMVDMPTRTSEKLMKMGERVTLWASVHIPLGE